MMSHVFISYARKNKKVVGQFVENLRTQDFIVWQDVSNISAGESWREAIFNAIDQASAVVVFWTTAAQESTIVNEEIDHAIAQRKLIIPVWLEKATPLRDGLDSANAIIASAFSAVAAQKIASALLTVAPRIQRQITDFNTRIPVNQQSIEGTKREMIGNREYVVVPLVQSVYSQAVLIAEPNTVISQVKRIQLMMQCTGAVGWTMPRDAFRAIAAEDAEYPDDAEPLVGVYVTGSVNPNKSGEYWIDNTNVAHYSDLIDTTRKAMNHLNGQAATPQTFQLFQKTLVDIAFLIGVRADRWIPFQLYKWTGDSYTLIMNISPRSPN